jgi:predicted methyltransferase
MKKILLACAVFLASHQTAFADEALKSAVTGSLRTPANVVRDSARHPYETLSFFGIKSNMTVLELAPGGGWYTEILTPYLRSNGQLMVAGVGKSLQARFDADPSNYNKVSVIPFDTKGENALTKNNSLDMVLTFRNIHNWMGNGEPALKGVFQQVFNSLKSGGVFGVVEHRLPVGLTQDEKASSGYVHQAYVIKMAQSVGFKLAASSEVNANPKDMANHEGGVWALPPVLRHKEKDKEKYIAIGESDRMTLKFVKP